MAEIFPQADRLSSTSPQRKLARGRVSKPRPVVVADQDQVRNVTKLIEGGRTFAQACHDAKITQAAFWRRVMNDPEMKREVACTVIGKAWDKADRFSDANISALPVFSKISEKIAASLAPADWGDKVLIEGRVLVIQSNLFEAEGRRELDGFCATLTEVEAVEAVEVPETLETDVSVSGRPAEIGPANPDWIGDLDVNKGGT